MRSYLAEEQSSCGHEVLLTCIFYRNGCCRPAKAVELSTAVFIYVYLATLSPQLKHNSRYKKKKSMNVLKAGLGERRLQCTLATLFFPFP